MGNKNKDTYTMTHSGKRFYPFDPDPGVIDIQDIAHALSLQCRYNGHVPEFYSVSQHSVRVSRLLENGAYGKRYALKGLLHDAAETYVGDMISPLKNLFPTFEEMEEPILNIIFRKYGVDDLDYAPVKQADHDMFIIEANNFFKNLENWGVPSLASPPPIYCLNPEDAKQNFLARFEELTR